MFFFIFRNYDAAILYKVKVTGDIGWQHYFHGEIVDTHVRYFRDTPFFITTLDQTRIIKERTNFNTTGYKVRHFFWTEKSTPFRGFFLAEDDGNIIESIAGDWNTARSTQAVIGQYLMEPRGCY